MGGEALPPEPAAQWRGKATARRDGRELRATGHRLRGMTSIRTVVLVATALLVVACESSGTPSAAPASLESRTFLSTQVQGHDLVAGTHVRLSFKDGQVGINAGCNLMSGAYQIVDGRLVVGNMATTQMGCEAPLMAQDQWVGAFVSGATVTLAGDALTLRNGDITMTLKDREVADPDRPRRPDTAGHVLTTAEP